jgi:hypothetical protein
MTEAIFCTNNWIDYFLLTSISTAPLKSTLKITNLSLNHHSKSPISINLVLKNFFSSSIRNICNPRTTVLSLYVFSYICVKNIRVYIRDTDIFKYNSFNLYQHHQCYQLFLNIISMHILEYPYHKYMGIYQ